ncbi:MAG: hypothetical protein PHS17_00990 [Desulfobacterales bacterium]|nr:hypothetical protein [Desulfobacterales bacterium]
MRTTFFVLTAAALVMVSAEFSPAVAQRQPVKSVNPEIMAPARPDSGDWIRVGYDDDGDGRIDRFEYLHRQDLERARLSSMQRQERAGTSTRDPGMREDGISELNTVTGRVEDLRRITLAGMEDEHQLAKIKTPDGRIARVDLGPAVNLRELDIRPGDTITVRGTRGTINDKAMLMASRIDAGGDTLSVGWPYDRRLSRYSGEILGVRSALFRNRTVPEQVFGRVLLDRGGVTTVNLGPSHMLSNMSPEELRGKQISFLAHPAKIGNRVALVAEELRIDGRTFQVDWTMAEVSRPEGSISRAQ